ncbi:MAG: NAD(P)H-hydrate dehydratase [Hyphomicrobiales bacterium]
MIKILPVHKIREADEYTIKHEPISSVDLMERAATRLFKWILKRLKKGQKVKVVCGPGNNGGDGLVIARFLVEAGFDTQTYIVKFTDKFSTDFAINYDRLKTLDASCSYITSKDDIPEFENNELVIDAIFGSGLSRIVDGLAGDVIESINSSDAYVVSIDIPSGLFADSTCRKNGGKIIRADYTLTIETPKLAFFMPENDEFVGRWEIIPIGLHKDYFDKAKISNFFVSMNDITPRLRGRSKFSHKGTFGHGLLISGAYGKIGAAVLASKAALRSGLGLLTVHVPKCGYNIIQTAVPEAMVSIDSDEENFFYLPKLDPYRAIAIGPGIGQSEGAKMGLKMLIQTYNAPIILDADALNIIADHRTWLSFLPQNSILTPHPGEFARLAGTPSDDFDQIEKARYMAIKFGIYIVLKGAHTLITTPDGRCFFNSTGNPGMATGGSGDVLTGIILGLLTQGYNSFDACVVGVYLHGLAADKAVFDKGYNSLIASDIINYLPSAFMEIEWK